VANCKSCNFERPITFKLLQLWQYTNHRTLNSPPYIPLYSQYLELYQVFIRTYKSSRPPHISSVSHLWERYLSFSSWAVSVLHFKTLDFINLIYRRERFNNLWIELSSLILFHNLILLMTVIAILAARGNIITSAFLFANTKNFRGIKRATLRANCLSKAFSKENLTLHATFPRSAYEAYQFVCHGLMH